MPDEQALHDEPPATPPARTVVVIDYTPPATHPTPRHEELARQLHRLGLKRQLAHLDGDHGAVGAIDAEMAPLYAEYDAKPDAGPETPEGA